MKHLLCRYICWSIWYRSNGPATMSDFAHIICIECLHLSKSNRLSIRLASEFLLISIVSWEFHLKILLEAKIIGYTECILQWILYRHMLYNFLEGHRYWHKLGFWLKLSNWIHCCIEYKYICLYYWFHKFGNLRSLQVY